MFLGQLPSFTHPSFFIGKMWALTFSEKFKKLNSAHQVTDSTALLRDKGDKTNLLFYLFLSSGNKKLISFVAQK